MGNENSMSSPVEEQFQAGQEYAARIKKAFAKEQYEQSDPEDTILIKLNELWHYLKSKKQIVALVRK